MTTVATIAGAALLAMSCSNEPTSTRQGQGRLAPFYGVSSPARATDRYIVVLADKSTVRATALRLAAAHGGSIKHVFDRVLGGFSVRLPARAVEVIRRDPAVLRVRQVEAGKFRLADHSLVNGGPWNLQRIRQRTLPLSGWYSWSETGAGVRIYVIDTGIRTTHAQFGTRASVGFDARPEDNRNGQDCHGHGTHVAGIAGGSTYGVAKSALLVAVKVNVACIGSIDPDDLIAGVNWVADNHVKPAVANLSIQGPEDADLDQAVEDAVGLGVTFAVAAGNFDGADACDFSPSGAAQAITVAATNNVDARPSFSNIGACVEIFAPGQGILSAWASSNTATQTLNGTSQATPHVAGTAANFLQYRPTATPDEIAAVISSRATQDVLTNIGTGSPNRLLYSHFNDITVSGPSSCSSGTTYTATVSASGGVGSTFTYAWQRGEPSGFGGGLIWVNAGNGPTYSQTCQGAPGTNSIWLRATATDEFGFHRTAYKSANVF